MSAPAESFDFFVSYARSDNTHGWITAFVAELIAEHERFTAGRKLRAFFDRHIITTGADWRLYLADGIAHSKLFLAFISPQYFASEWCRKEWQAWMEAEIAGHILTAGVRPIYLVEVPGLVGKGQLDEQQLAREVARLCSLPDTDKAKLLAGGPAVIQQLRRRQLSHDQPFCDVQSFYDAGVEALRREDLRRVLQELARDLEQHSELCARAAASLSTVPPYNRRFTGRLEELLALREHLLKDDRTGVITGVHGLGGMGKTELAFAYAHAYASAYSGGRFLLRCEGQTSLRDAVLRQSDFAALFREQISDEERKQPEVYAAALLACLRQRLEKFGHVLLLLDNVTHAALLTPHETELLTSLGPQLHLLATTRLAPPSAGRSHWMALGQLPESDSLDLLEKYRPFADEAERAAGQKIVRRLGGLTLAVELVAAHLAEHPGVSAAQLAGTIGLEDLEHADVIQSGEALRYEHDRRLSAVLAPALASLAAPERRALEYAAFLPPDQVSLPWLRTLVVADFPELGQPARLTNPWDDLWRRLEKLAFLSRDEDETTEPQLVRVHRLVQQLVRRELGEAEGHARQKAVDALVEQRCATLAKTTTWVEARWELRPLTALARLWDETNHSWTSWLLNQMGLRWKALAEWAEAEPLYRRALAIEASGDGPKHPEFAIRLNNLALLLFNTNRLPEAELLMRRALTVSEQSHGPAHASVVTRLNNLALLLRDTNRLAEAETLMRRALAIDERSPGREHSRGTTSLNTLALLLFDTNRLGEAETLMRRALAIDEQSYGAEHPRVAIHLNNLAQLLCKTNRLGEAELLMRRVLAIDEQSYGAEHSHVAVPLNNLAQLLQATNRLQEAEPLMRRALALDEQSYGPDHPRVATELNNLAMLFKDTHRLPEAESLMRRALAIDELSRGPEHPEVARDLDNLALLLRDMNRLPEAEPLVRRALRIYTTAHGGDHPNTRCARNNYENLLRTMGYEEGQVQARFREIAANPDAPLGAPPGM
jgi:tetratricopeptide (TPR) repeat protein